MKKHYFFIGFYILIWQFALSQRKLSPPYKIPANEKIFGNSWSISGSINFASNNAWNVSAGRTYGQELGGGGAPAFKFTTWGGSYEQTYTIKPHGQFLSFFIEHTMAAFTLGYNARIDYKQSLNGLGNYLVPSLGYSFFGTFELSYTYAIPLAGQENLFKS